MIKHNLKTKLENLKEKWVDNLSEVLWAYMATARSTIGETPFSLAYEYEVVAPVEHVVGSLRGNNFDLKQNMILQQRELDFLEENDMTHNFGSQRINDALLGMSTRRWRRGDSK